MAGITTGSFSSPNETRTPPKTKIEIVTMGSATALRATFEPGWRWSECVKPVVGTETCRLHHVGFVQSGRLHIKHDDGAEVEIAAGDTYVVEPGHDAWVVGDETFVALEFDSGVAATPGKS